MSREEMMNEVKEAIKRVYSKNSLDVENGYVTNHKLLCTLEYCGMITEEMYRELRRFNLSLYSSVIMPQNAAD